MGNPLTTEEMIELQPGQLITLCPGRGPMDRFPFLASVDRVLDTNPPVIYARTTKAQKDVRLVPVYRGTACDRFNLTGSRGEWQVSKGYDTEFLDPAM